MTRFDDSRRRAGKRGANRYAGMTQGRAVRGQARGIALSVAIILSSCASSDAAQYQTTGSPFAGTQQYQTAQYQKAQAQYQAQARAQQQQQVALQSKNAQQSKSTRKPLLSGLMNSGAPTQPAATSQYSGQRAPAGQPQEPQRSGIFGSQPIISSLKNAGSRSPQEQRQSQEFHARSQHMNAQGGYVGSAGAPGESTLAQASSNPMEAQEALSKVPWELFPAKTRERIEKVAASPTMYRRLPMAGGRCNPELFDYFLTYPNAVVELWKQMGYDEVDMKQVGPNVYAVAEKGGSNGKLTILYQSAELAVAHVSGVYRGAGLIRPVEGEAFLILQTRYTEDAAHTPLVICRLDAFVDIKNPGVDLVARTFNAMVGKIADTNFEQTLAFIDSVSQTAEQDPRQFQSVAAQLRGLSPEARQILAAKAFDVAQQAQRRNRGEIVDYQLLAKVNDPNPGYARILSRGNTSAGSAGATSIARQSQGSFKGYSTSGDSFADGAIYDSGYEDASFAESGFQTPNAVGKPFGSNRGFTLSDDDFALDDGDGFESSVDWNDGDTLMTGDEYLATQSLSSLRSKEGAPSLAKVGVKASTNVRALNLLDAEEDDPDALAHVDTTRTLSTESGSGSGFVVSDDDELVIDDSFAVDLEDEEDAPAAIPLSTRKTPPFRPSAIPYTANQRRPAALNAAPLAAVTSDSDEEEEGDVAEISVDENGMPVLEFTIDDDADADDAAAPAEGGDELAIAIPSEDAETAEINADFEIALDEGFAPVASDDANADGFTPHVAQPADPYAEEAAEESDDPDAAFEEGGWTRSALANQKVAERVRKTTAPRGAVKTEDAPDAERPRPVTRRYSPPLAADNRSKAVKTIKEVEESKAKDAETESEDGQRVATYHWTPVPGAFVTKTAAVDLNENTLSPKTAKFEKPELR